MATTRVDGNHTGSFNIEWDQYCESHISILYVVGFSRCVSRTERWNEFDNHHPTAKPNRVERRDRNLQRDGDRFRSSQLHVAVQWHESTDPHYLCSGSGQWWGLLRG